MHLPAPGHYVTVSTASEPFKAFVPAPLPPQPRIGIVGELTNRQRGRVFSYPRYVDELTAELERTA